MSDWGEPRIGDIWYDTNFNPAVRKSWNGEEWVPLPPLWYIFAVARGHLIPATIL